MKYLMLAILVFSGCTTEKLSPVNNCVNYIENRIGKLDSTKLTKDQSEKYNFAITFICEYTDNDPEKDSGYPSNRCRYWFVKITPHTYRMDYKCQTT